MIKTSAMFISIFNINIYDVICKHLKSVYIISRYHIVLIENMYSKLVGFQGYAIPL